jgi:hypothetical protein
LEIDTKRWTHNVVTDSMREKTCADVIICG